MATLTNPLAIPTYYPDLVSMPDGIKVDTKELRKLAKEISDAETKTMAQVHTAVAQFAYLIDSKAKRKIQKGSRSGRRYRRGGKNRQRSSEGEAPKTDTGRLVSSIRPVLGPGYFQAEVGSLNEIARYGGMLEDGTKNMAARPWLEPTLKENQGAMARIFTAAIKSGGLAS